ncbi:MAG: glycosyltransferase [Terriglobia bacterium]
MRILLIHNYYQEPGGEDVVFAQERELLTRFGNVVSTYVRNNREIRTQSARQRATLAWNVIWADDAKRDVLRLIHEDRPDVVHAHNTFTQISPSIYEACRESGVPLVQSLHNFRLLCPSANFFRSGHVCQECPRDGLWRSLLYGCYRQSHAATAAVVAMLAVHRRRHTWQEKVDGYIALSDFARRAFIQGGIPEAKLHIKPNFVYPDPRPRSGGGDYALFIGRLSPEKGIRTLAEAWGRLNERRIPLRVVGGGPLHAELQSALASRGLDQVRLCGHLSREKTTEALQRARFLVLPSECFENFPLVIAEAFACGKPVICSRLGSMQELVTDGQTGLHFSPGDPEDLAAKVEWAWSHPRTLHEMGRAARREYEANYTAEKNYETLMNIYRKVHSRN